MILTIIKLLAKLILGSEVFARILAAVERVSHERIDSAEKRHTVLAEIEIIGLNITESLARLGIELAVAYLKRV
jgi:fibronectin type 3 domain-containing protein